MNRIRNQKAKHWSFVIPSFNEEIKTRLSKVTLSPNVMYCSYGICEDDTCNRYAEGYMAMKSPSRVTTLKRLVGFGYFKVCGGKVSDLLTKLRLNKEFVEFGNPPQNQGSRNDLEGFYKAVKADLTRDQLKKLFPSVFKRFPALVDNLTTEEPCPPTDAPISEWVKIGCPIGLPWEVYKAAEKGEPYMPTVDRYDPNSPKTDKAELCKSILNLYDPKHLKDAGKGRARKVFLAWRNAFEGHKP